MISVLLLASVLKKRLQRDCWFLSHILSKPKKLDHKRIRSLHCKWLFFQKQWNVKINVSATINDNKNPAAQNKYQIEVTTQGIIETASISIFIIMRRYIYHQFNWMDGSFSGFHSLQALCSMEIYYLWRLNALLLNHSGEQAWKLVEKFFKSYLFCPHETMQNCSSF